MKWDLLDFVSMGALLSGTSLLIVFAGRKIKKSNHLILVIIAILVAMLLIWAELAVGIFGTPFAGS